jgi:short-subunit dehydrogenase
MKNYLITGANGSIAKEFIEKVYNEKDNFYFFYNKAKPIFFYKKKNINFLKFDFEESNKISDFLTNKFNYKKKIDIIINFAATASPYKEINKLNYFYINKIYNVNLFTPLLLFLFFINQHLKCKLKKKGS